MRGEMLFTVRTKAVRRAGRNKHNEIATIFSVNGQIRLGAIRRDPCANLPHNRHFAYFWESVR